MSDKKKVSFLMTFFNEEEQISYTLDALYPEVLRLQKKNYFDSFEILLVDDGSKDATWEKIEAFSQSHTGVVGLKLSRNFGKEAAMCAGLDAVSGDAVITLDGDLQHPLSLMEKMLEKWHEGYALVEGEKAERHKESYLRKQAAHLYNKLFKNLSGLSLGEASDYKLLSREVLEAWKSLGERQSFFRGMVAWLGFEKCVLPFEVAEREHGVSKWDTVKLIRLALDTLTSFSVKPLYIPFLLTGGFFSIFLVFFVLSLVKGFSFLLPTLVFFMGTCILFSLSIIAFYLSKIFEEIKGRPRYLLAKRVEKTSTEEA